MNDRLYELMNQAFIGTTDGKLSELNTVANIEKFAELIIKECIKEIGHKSVDLLDVDLFPHYQERLKKHFGVKE